MRKLVVFVSSLLLAFVVACADSSPAGPSTVAPITSLAQVGIQCPTDQPVVTVGAQDGRTDITWSVAPGQTTFLVWLRVEEGNDYVSYPGAPITAEGSRFEIRLDDTKVHEVVVQSICGDVRGIPSAPVVFGGRAGYATPAPTPKPPSKPVCTWVKKGKKYVKVCR